MITTRDAREGPYQCGFDPEKRSLAETVRHWEWCNFAQCRQSLKNWLQFKAEILARWGSPVESLDAYPDHRHHPDDLTIARGVEKSRGATA